MSEFIVHYVRIQSYNKRIKNLNTGFYKDLDTNFEQAWAMTNYIADTGLTYFAFNTKIQACAHNHAFYGTKCPICGGDVATEYTRVVGFYVPIRTWSKERKAEYKLREWEDVSNGKSLI